MRLEIEEQQRAQHLRVTHRGRQLQQASVHRPIDEAQIEPQRRRPAIGALERGRQRVEQAREHERQRLELVDRPFQIDRLDESGHTGIRDERRQIDPRRQPLQHEAGLPHPLGEIGGRQSRQSLQEW